MRHRREQPLEIQDNWDEDDEDNLVPAWMIDVSTLGPEAALQQTERRALLRRLVEGLPEDKREVFRLVHEMEMSMRGTATDARGEKAIVRHSYVAGLTPAEMYACVTEARRGLFQWLQRWEQLGQGVRERAEGNLLAQCLHKGFTILDRLINFGSMIVVISQRGINVGQSQIVLGSDFVSAQPHPLVPDDDILHRDAPPGDARFATNHPWRTLNMSI